MSTSTLLVEIGCEDLPARYQQALVDALAGEITKGLDSADVSRGSLKKFVTPRRVAVAVDAVSAQQPDQRIERLGPALKAALRDGAPSPAGLGFAKSCGVEFDALEQVTTDKGEYLVYRAEQPGKPLVELLPAIFADCIRQMDRLAPKRMRWGDGDATFVRPVQWLCAMHGSQVVPLEAFGLKSSNITFGHRFHTPEALALHSADDYENALREAQVWADAATRRAEIARQVTAAGLACGGTARLDDDLLDEVTALVEWPIAIHGRFEERFLDVPAEAIVLTIQENQRYFPVFDTENQLLPAFITVANIDSRDMAQVVAGNERVVRPRLDDALFFWEQDLKTPLEDRLPELARVSWAQGLGSLRDKADRLEALCHSLAAAFQVDAAKAARAGHLAKCDLVTKMVFEMTDLQGIMGGHYLRRAEPDQADVAAAIAAHYRPAGPGEAIPETPLGQLLALADKLDTLCGYFSINAIPTASKDPFGLRRAALGGLRILLEGQHAIPMHDLLDAVGFTLSNEQRSQLVTFLHDRLRGLLIDRGLPAQVVASVLDAASGPLDALKRAESVAGFMQTQAGSALAATSKRVRNILSAAGEMPVAAVDSKLFEHEAENALQQVIATLAPTTDYGAALAALATLQAPIDAFFDNVMVNADDPAVRNNRIALLRQFDGACSQIADFAVLASGV